MKSKIYIPAIILLQSFIISGQHTSRFPVNPQARWKVSNIEYTYDDNAAEKITEKYEYFIHGDTVINTQLYYKIFKSGVFYYDDPFNFDSVYSGAIRDENNTICFVEKGRNAEVLLFDFNLEPGDTIKSDIGKDRVINQVDSLSDGRKIFSSVPEICGGCCTTITLIEGIGHSGGLTETPPCFHIGFFGHFLNCYSVNDELIYHNEMSLVNCSDFFSDIDTPLQIGQINIYPVPAKDKLTIEIPDIQKMPMIIQVYSVTGSLVTAAVAQSTRTDVYVNMLNNGIYLISVSNDNVRLIKKFMIEN